MIEYAFIFVLFSSLFGSVTCLFQLTQPKNKRLIEAELTATFFQAIIFWFAIFIADIALTITALVLMVLFIYLATHNALENNKIELSTIEPQFSVLINQFKEP
jgi:hypothetical protein